MTVFFISVWIAFNYWNPWTKGIVIAALNWGSVVHLYEVLVIAAPLYPALEAWRRRRNREPIFTRDFLATLVPLGSFMSPLEPHVYRLRRVYGYRLYWMRNPEMKIDPISVLDADVCSSGNWRFQPAVAACIGTGW